MGCIGVLFSVDEEIVEHIKSLPMEQRPYYISEELEDLFFEEYPEKTAELDEYWDIIHRAITNGTLSFDTDEYPLNAMVLGGDVLYFDGDKYDDYIIVAKNPEMVQKLAVDISKLTKSEFKRGFLRIGNDYSENLSNDDVENAWECLQDTIPFLKLAAKNKQWVLFTVDQ